MKVIKKIEKIDYYGKIKPNRLFWVNSSDGTKLRTGLWQTKGSPKKATVIFCHGNTEFLEKNEYFFRDLNQMGYDVLAFDFRCHGLSDGHKQTIMVDSFDKYYEDLASVEAWLFSRLEQQEKVVYVSHSFSGVLLANQAADTQSRLSQSPQVKGMVLLSPMWGIQLPYPKFMVQSCMALLTMVAPWVNVKQESMKNLTYETDGCANDEKAWHEKMDLYQRNPELFRDKISAKWLYQALNHCDQIQQKDLSHVRIPALCLYPENESVTCNQAIKTVAKVWSSLKIQEIPNTKHELLSCRDHQRMQVLKAVANHLDHCCIQAHAKAA